MRGHRLDRRSRLLIRLYPPAWRTRYATEFAALLADTGIGVREVVNVARAAGGAWVHPARRLHDRPARMRTSAAVILGAWGAAAAGAVLFAKLTRDGALYLGGGTAPAWWYDGYVAAAFLSTALMVGGGLPLAVAMITGSPRDRRLHTGALVAAPLLTGFCYAGVAYTIARLLPLVFGSEPGRGWFYALIALGLVAVAAGAAGPARAVTRVRTTGAALSCAVVAGSCATALMAAATIASLTYELALPGHPADTVVIAYGPAMGAALAVAGVSSVRGLRAVRWPTPAHDAR